MNIGTSLAKLAYSVLRAAMIAILGPRKFVEHCALTMATDLGEVFGRHCQEAVAIILGTGWGDTLEIEHEITFPLSRFWFLRGLEDLHGHRRSISFGYIGSQPAIVLRGRIHLNEEASTPGASLMWRIVIECLAYLDAKTLITTAAVGALGNRAAVGNIVVANGFFAPSSLRLALFTGEFCAPDAILDDRLRTIAMRPLPNGPTGMHLRTIEGGYAFFLGPNFEGPYNKHHLFEAGCTCVGMSTLPEVAYWSTHKGHRALSVNFVTNDEDGHSHEENVAKAKAAAPLLAALLHRIVISVNPR
jgi:purine-nucleoside phosphorylase